MQHDVRNFRFWHKADSSFAHVHKILLVKLASTRLLFSKQFLNTLRKVNKSPSSSDTSPFNLKPPNLTCSNDLHEHNYQEHVEASFPPQFPHCQLTNHTYNVSSLETKGKDARSLKNAFRYGGQTFSHSITRPGRPLPGTKKGTLPLTRRHAKTLSQSGQDEIPGKMVGH